MQGWLTFADKLTDLEDELQRMKMKCEQAHEDEAATAAATAAESLLHLARIVLEREGSLPMAENY